MNADQQNVIACPKCQQKYRVPQSRLGHHALCRKCGQRFKLSLDQPIDEDTIFGWLMDGDPAGESVMGSTAIIDSPKRKAKPEPARPDVPETPRIRFDRIDEIGAYFEFPSFKLEDRGLRMSFPMRCANCLRKEGLNVHVLIWSEKLPGKDAIRAREAEMKMVRRLSSLQDQFGSKWFDYLDEVGMLQRPYSLAFPYYVCNDCSSIGTVTCHILHHKDREFCQIAVSNLTVALDFYANNGGKNTRSYEVIKKASHIQKNDKWTAMPFAVRAKISQWFKPLDGEQFKGFFADRDFAHSEAGAAGLVLTDQRIVFKKYAALREFTMNEEGRMDVESSRAASLIEVSQEGKKSAVLTATPVVASNLSTAIQELNHDWRIKIRNA